MWNSRSQSCWIIAPMWPISVSPHYYTIPIANSDHCQRLFDIANFTQTFSSAKFLWLKCVMCDFRRWADWKAQLSICESASLILSSSNFKKSCTIWRDLVSTSWWVLISMLPTICSLIDTADTLLVLLAPLLQTSQVLHDSMSGP